jgi:biopolymer transport protein ExbD
MNMTPMIDIVFLLIIFFMTVTQVSEVNKESVQLPTLEGSEDQKPTVITINVTQEGLLRISGETVTFPRLVGLIESERARLGGDPRRLTIVVRSDERGTSQMTNDVIRTLGQLDINRVRIAVETEQ